MDYNNLHRLTGNLDQIDSLSKHSGKIELVAKVQNTGYGASIYDAAPDTIISLKVEKDFAEFILGEYRKFLEKKIEDLLNEK